ncbi:hypothetical protein, partial [Streptomyces coeruleorubidus]|uniref:hypothetical protein n=1 Tax=Streptomyces coeruleorubidus TaxID=116188 RepID=UPI001E59770B
MLIIQSDRGLDPLADRLVVNLEALADGQNALQAVFPTRVGSGGLSTGTLGSVSRTVISTLHRPTPVGGNRQPTNPEIVCVTLSAGEVVVEDFCGFADGAGHEVAVDLEG